MKIETAREYLKRLWICEAPKGMLTTNDVVEAMEEYAKYRAGSKVKKFHKPPISGRSEQFICPDNNKSKKEYSDELCGLCHKWHEVGQIDCY
mgnify:CR=1 FL=1